MENNKIEILVQESGIEQKKGELITDALSEFFTKADEWNYSIKTLTIKDVNDTANMKVARDGRLTLKNMRVHAKKLVESRRKEVKNKMADFVLEDKLWLKSFQMIEAIFKNLESKLEEKEKYAERIESERLDNIKQQRVSELTPYAEVCDIDIVDLRNMSSGRYTEYLASVQKLYDLHQKEKQIIEEDRIKKEAEQEKREEENARLKAEVEKREEEEKARTEKKQKAEEDLRKLPIKEQLKSWIYSFELPKTELDNNVTQEVLKKFEDFKNWSKNKTEEL